MSNIQLSVWISLQYLYICVCMIYLHVYMHIYIFVCVRNEPRIDIDITQLLGILEQRICKLYISVK